MQFTVEPGGFSFPGTLIGTTSTINAVATLTSTGSAIQLLDISSSNPSEFPVTTTCAVPGAIAPGTTCLVSIQFKPSSFGTRSAQITIRTTSGLQASITVSGGGVQVIVSQITLSPESFVFPDTVVGSTSVRSAVITLTGTGAALIQLTAITISDPNEFPTTTTCNMPGTLAPGASCTVSVQFRPNFSGNRSSLMTITTSNGGTATFSVSGAGI